MDSIRPLAGSCWLYLLPCIADGWYQPQGNESNAVLRRQIEQAKFVVLDNVSGARLHEMLALSGGLGRVAIALVEPEHSILD